MATADSSTLESRACALVVSLGLARADLVGAITPLSGGVSSDIARVDLPGRSICVKFALPKLRVAAEWRAPVRRNAAEYAWLEVAGRLAPGAAPALLGRDAEAGGFAMALVEAPVWKAALLAGAPAQPVAAAVGTVLGRIHAGSSSRGFDGHRFANADDFHALRIEPYLLHTARAHPDRAGVLEGMAGALYRADRVLIHGDVSPKNILLAPAGPCLLDGECATMGDPAFDPAFCLSHLVLKAVHMPALAGDRLAAARALWRGYAAHVHWEAPEAVEARTARLLPALMLARVDGKSPVEYLTEASRDRVRRLARVMLVAPPRTLEAALGTIADEGTL